ncbi:beta-agarase [Vibrio sp. SM6]|uniref:Beta-agarase n=1 Tax=Vibrio agarilyticus TaxID=2726741 RepID=A0A7X8TSY0_9VIBR|nr:beta-galactosidase [Vibrio agarilyticus]NLS14220.1 beta-agarase [Vibrio agarilyticus]
MEIKKTSLAMLVAVALTGLYGCNSTGSSSGTASSATEVEESAGAATPDFESQSFVDSLVTDHAKVQLVTDAGVTNGTAAVRVDFDAVSEANKFKYWPNVKIMPQGELWNWNNKGSFKLDITNPTDSPANIILKIVDNVGQMGAETNQLNYAVSLAAGETQTVEMLFNGGKRKLEGYWGGDNLNLRKLAEFQVFVQGPMDKQTIILDNLELIEATGDFISAEEKVVAAGPIPTLAVVTEFNDGDPTFVAAERSVSATTRVVDTENGKGLEVKLSASNDYPNVTFMPPQPWNWSEAGDFNIAFDIENPTDDPVQVFVRVDQAENSGWGGTADGVKDSISSYTTLLPNKKSTYYMPISQLKGHVVSGMRAEPPKMSYDAQAISYGWGETSLNTSNIHAIQLYLQNPTKDAKFIVDSIRLIPNIDADATRYNGIVDQYGQFKGDGWLEKIKSDDQLIEKGKQELANLGKAKPMADRCKFGGYANGPRLEATGFFRTEKVDGKWNLVDPEGCLFFMTGLDNVRMADTVTITGVDFTDPKARTGREVTSDLRHSMFEWLPEESDRLAEAYSYAGYVHSGAVKKGEVFSFYQANLMRKYNVDKQEAMKIWKDVTLDRMVDWGFTTLGNWIDPMFFGSERIAYEAHGWIQGDHKRISTGNDYWGPIHDPFDPEFKVSAREMAEGVAGRVNNQNDPWLLGVFVDNEISWGNPLNEANHYGLIINALAYDVKGSPAKRAFTDHLKGKYTTIAALNQAWGVNVASWADFEKSFDYRTTLKPGMKADYSDMLTMLSEKYFSTVRAEIKRVLPNHLYLGARFSDWGVTEEIARGAAKYVDVMSYNLYSNDLNGKKAHWRKLLPELDKPSVIGEFHFGATDTGLFHGGIVSVGSQKERGEMYKHYMQSMVDNPYMVGAHWFQYLDSPATGRAWDGENYNVGFITIGDEPYVELIKAAKEFNRDLYTNRFK